MRSNSPALTRPGGAPRSDAVKRWLRRADPVLVAGAHVAEPVALALVVLTGLLLPRLSGAWAPVPACRALHLLAGLVLVLVLAYRGTAKTVLGIAWLARGGRHAASRPARVPAVGWRRLRDVALEAAYQVTLLVEVASGIAQAWSLRTGQSFGALLTAAQSQAIHAMAAPYFYTALLLLSYVAGRRRARALIRELRSP